MRLLVLLLLALTAIPAGAETPGAARWAGAGEYDPAPGQPLGRKSPLAPAEISQFGFMLGQFNCHDRIPREEGKVLEFDSTWNATYFLNGMGIQDYNSGPRRSTTNLRLYDPGAKQWTVTYFTMPNYYSGVWKGGMRDGAMVLDQETLQEDGSKTISRLTFYDIKQDSYKWKSESITSDLVTQGWSKTCVRVGTGDSP